MGAKTFLANLLEKVAKDGRGTVVQSVERPSKVTVWCNSTVGLNRAEACSGRKIPAAPSDADVSTLLG